MNARIDNADALRAFESLQNAGPRARELAAVLDERRTRVRVTKKIVGGLTLNFVNTIFLQPLRTQPSDFDFKFWVSLLAHEACHVEQKYWIDSVQQEIRAYATQAIVAAELGIDLGYLKHAFANLNPDSPNHQRLAQAALASLFGNTPAGIVYASLPLRQPNGIHTFIPALRELEAILRAAWQRPKT